MTCFSQVTHSAQGVFDMTNPPPPPTRLERFRYDEAMVLLTVPFWLGFRSFPTDPWLANLEMSDKLDLRHQLARHD